MQNCLSEQLMQWLEVNAAFYDWYGVFGMLGGLMILDACSSTQWLNEFPFRNFLFVSCCLEVSLLWYFPFFLPPLVGKVIFASLGYRKGEERGGVGKSWSLGLDFHVWGFKIEAPC